MSFPHSFASYCPLYLRPRLYWRCAIIILLVILFVLLQFKLQVTINYFFNKTQFSYGSQNYYGLVKEDSGSDGQLLKETDVPKTEDNKDVTEAPSTYIRNSNKKTEELSQSSSLMATVSRPNISIFSTPAHITKISKNGAAKNILLNDALETLPLAVEPIATVVPVLNQTTSSMKTVEKFLTLEFGGACMGRISNKLYEFMALYGMARTLNRIPYVDISCECARQALDELVMYFPNLRQVFEMKSINESAVATRRMRDVLGCCSYGNVEKLKEYQSSSFLKIANLYLQSYKYFDNYRQDVLQLLSFTEEDISITNVTAYETFQGNIKDHKLCVHTRRTDFTYSTIHKESSEEFTKTAALYIRQKLLNQGKNVTIALLGDDHVWLTSMILGDAWAVMPTTSDKPSIDYAFFARHCQTILLTAPVSTFGFWSAYLSSAEEVYFNTDYVKNPTFRNEIVEDDFFPMQWIPLSLNKETSTITEKTRSSKSDANF